MTVEKDKISSDLLAEIAVKGIQEKKGMEITCLNLKEVKNAVADYFIICHGNSNTHVAAIADSVEDEIRKAIKEKPWHREGSENRQWLLLDFVNVVVHVFQQETREFYNLEDLWADAKVEQVDSVV